MVFCMLTIINMLYFVDGRWRACLSGKSTSSWAFQAFLWCAWSGGHLRYASSWAEWFVDLALNVELHVYVHVYLEACCLRVFAGMLLAGIWRHSVCGYLEACCLRVFGEGVFLGMLFEGV
jgi:hypothetical protein